jgi:hypothetical protein
VGLFICENCFCVDNTALGHYWGREKDCWEDESFNGKALCCSCIPDKFSDGSEPIKVYGEGWHDQFEKRHYKVYLEEHPNAEIKNISHIKKIK